MAIGPLIVADMSAHQHGHGGRRGIGRGIAAGRGRDTRFDLGIGKINPTIMRGHVQHAAVLTHENFGRASHRIGQKLAVIDHAQCPAAFGDQHASVRQEGFTPWRFQAGGDDLDLEILLLAVDHLPVGTGHERRIGCQLSAPDVQIGDHLADLIVS